MGEIHASQARFKWAFASISSSRHMEGGSAGPPSLRPPWEVVAWWWGWAEDPAEQPAFFFQVECLPGPGLFQGLSFFWFMAMLAGFSVTTPRNSSENSNLYCVLTSSCRPRGQRSQNEGCLSEGRGSPPRRPTGDPGLNLGAGVWPLSQTRKPSASAILGLSAPQTPTLFYSYEER